jgi:hypothetical protein
LRLAFFAPAFFAVDFLALDVFFFADVRGAGLVAIQFLLKSSIATRYPLRASANVEIVQTR